MKKEISIGLHRSPPWTFLNEQKEIVGIEKEIIETIFTRQGYTTRFYIYSYSRLLKEFHQHKLDFASPFTGPQRNSFKTDTYLPFKDIAITLKRHHVKLETIGDLNGKRIIAYQHASSILGKEFSQLINISRASYREIAHRRNQLKMLIKNRTDVVIGEQRILHNLGEELLFNQLISQHYIFPACHYGGGAWRKALAHEFNAGLALLKQSGEYQEILNKY